MNLNVLNELYASYPNIHIVYVGRHIPELYNFYSPLYDRVEMPSLYMVGVNNVQKQTYSYVQGNDSYPYANNSATFFTNYTTNITNINIVSSQRPQETLADYTTHYFDIGRIDECDDIELYHLAMSISFYKHIDIETEIKELQSLINLNSLANSLKTKCFSYSSALIYPMTNDHFICNKMLYFYNLAKICWIYKYKIIPPFDLQELFKNLDENTYLYSNAINAYGEFTAGTTGVNKEPLHVGLIQKEILPLLREKLPIVENRRERFIDLKTRMLDKVIGS